MRDLITELQSRMDKAKSLDQWVIDLAQDYNQERAKLIEALDKADRLWILGRNFLADTSVFANDHHDQSAELLLERVNAYGEARSDIKIDGEL